MKLLHDYFYRLPSEHLGQAVRCRVRIYKRKNGTHTVLLTELDTNFGEPIAVACDRIATGLVAAKGLNPKTTRWIQHDPPDDDLPQEFAEIQFTWDSNNIASEPRWQRLEVEQAEALTGDTLNDLNRRLGDFDVQVEKGADHAETEAEGAA